MGIYNHNQNTRILVDGRSMTAVLNDSDMSNKRKSHDVTTYGMADEAAQGGLFTGTAKLKGFFSQADYDALDGAAIVTRWPALDTIGAPAEFMAVFSSNTPLNMPASAILQMEVDLASSVRLDMGVSQHALGAETATGAFTSVDGLAASANGGAGVVHVTVASAGVSGTLIIEHSANNSTWSTLLTFAALTATGAQIVAVPAGTAVQRYTRARLSALTGTTPSLTFACAFARR